MANETLGRGLGSLIPPKKIKQNLQDKEIVPASNNIREIEVDKIRPNPQQPRQDFDRASLEDLINSIKEHGIIQPLVVSEVDGSYQVIAGERRLRASKIVGLKKVPVVYRSVSEQEKLELALVENVQRQNLNPIEKSYGYQRLIDEFNLSQEQVAKKVGQSRAAVGNTLRLLSLPAEIQTSLQQGKLTEGHAKVLLSVKSRDEQLKLFKQLLRGGVSVRKAEHEARKISGRPLSSSRKKTKDPNILAKEEELQESLGTKVEISRQGDQGKVVIHYYSGEELQEIIKKITG